MRTQRRKTARISTKCNQVEVGRRTNHEHAKHLRDKPSVALDATPVLHQLSLCALDIVHNILGVGVYPLDLFALLTHHLQSSQYLPHVISYAKDLPLLVGQRYRQALWSPVSACRTCNSQFFFT
jgi:hypothetical protein